MLAFDEFGNAFTQQLHRQAAIGEHGIVKRAQIKIIAQRLLGLLTQIDDGQLANLVRQCLTRPGNVAIDLGAHIQQRQRGVGGQIILRLFARPAHGVDAGVDDQPAGAPHFVAEAAEVIIRGLINAHFHAQFLGVQRPAFTVGVRIELLSIRRHIFHFQAQRRLRVVARRRFMQSQCGEVVQRPLVQRESIDPIIAAPVGVQR